MNLQYLVPRARLLPGLIRSYSADSNGKNIADVGRHLLECYRVLELPQSCSKEELKSRYVDLAKRYHPDTGGKTANADQFRRLHHAYKFIVDNDYSVKDRQELENVPKMFDIRHTAPQHRQYLEFGGVGHGTPSQRMRQYQQHRVMKASENVNEYMVDKLMRNDVDHSLITKTVEEREYARKWKTRTAVDRLVEDLIQESMRRGEFENLSGKGKPLAYDTHNPYLDSMTHKLNQVLIQNGFCPEWVLMEKEIRTEMRRIKGSLADARKKMDDDPYMIRVGERERFWNDKLTRLRDDCSVLNKRIDSFNLLVPSLHKQMVHFSLDKEIAKLNASRENTTESTHTGEDGSANKVDHSGRRADGSPTEDTDPQRPGDAQHKPAGIFRMLFSALKAH